MTDMKTDPVAWRYKKSWEKTGWKVCDKHPTDNGIDDECYEIQALYAEQPAPVAVVIPDFETWWADTGEQLTKHEIGLKDLMECAYTARLNGVKT